MARMGDRLRVAGGASLGAAPRRPIEPTLARLYAALEGSFPGATRTARAQPWVGRQAHTVDGLPAVGSIQSGLWLNIGHGANAWSTVPACSRLLADQVAGRPVADCASLLAPTRLR
jgi:D-amino-acid dehydrogenase